MLCDVIPKKQIETTPVDPATVLRMTLEIALNDDKFALLSSVAAAINHVLYLWVNQWHLK